LRINEWLASPLAGDDWFELFNPAEAPVALDGVHLTDDPSLSGKTKFKIAPLSFIGGRSWVVWEADSNPSRGPDHVTFNLDQLGDALRVYGATGELIDGIEFGFQTGGTSEGRVPDGTGEIRALSQGPTPGISNTANPAQLDSDADGLPDAWERAHGTQPSVADSNADPDRDGFTNLQEFLSGTDPADAASSLRIVKIVQSPTTTSLDVLTVSNRTYSVLYKVSLSDAAWKKAADLPATQSTGTRTIGVLSAPETSRFYRIITPAQP
jgi:hypothetical protein